jgi:predicted CoA-binding protein
MNQISELLQNAHTIAVVGLSGKRFRPSYGVAEYMQRAGYRIIPVNPGETQVLGETCYPDLEAIPEAIDIVDIFRRSGSCRSREQPSANTPSDLDAGA